MPRMSTRKVSSAETLIACFICAYPRHVVLLRRKHSAQSSYTLPTSTAMCIVKIITPQCVAVLRVVLVVVVDVVLVVAVVLSVVLVVVVVVVVVVVTTVVLLLQ